MAQQADNRSVNGVEAVIARLAEPQHGVVARGQLRAAGLSGEVIDGLVRRGRLRRLHRGVYLVGPVAPRLAYESAALLACGRAAVISHGTAAVFHRLLRDSADEDRKQIEVTVPPGSRLRRPKIVAHRKTLDRSEWWPRDGLRVTTPPRTLLDLAASRPGLIGGALNEAFARRQVSHASLTDFLARHPRRAGTPVLRRLLAHGQGPTRSDPERELGRLIRLARLPEPETNARVGRWEVDMYWPDHGLVVEVDAYSTHSSPDAFERDRAREAELRALGLQLRRFTAWQISSQPEATVASLAAELAGSAAT